ncbi:MAG: AbrB/MazE/SpoVT family DNA-binding domain-containing protein [Verrucomicrobia bacterium]|nr:AbrB/MazE/SpoVT family DNA-binding domain-containing protein [Verrucomicrobiota bacterium]
MTTELTADGRIAIPRELIERLALRPGQALEVQCQGDLLLAWSKKEDDPFARWRGRGTLPVGQTVDEYLRLTRDDHGP